MFEVADAGKDHGDFMLVGRLNHFLIADGPSGLDDRRHTAFGRGID